MYETPPHDIAHEALAHFLGSHVSCITTHQQVQPTVWLTVIGFSPFLPQPCFTTLLFQPKLLVPPLTKSKKHSLMQYTKLAVKLVILFLLT